MSGRPGPAPWIPRRSPPARARPCKVVANPAQSRVHGVRGLQPPARPLKPPQLRAAALLHVDVHVAAQRMRLRCGDLWPSEPPPRITCSCAPTWSMAPPVPAAYGTSPMPVRLARFRPTRLPAKIPAEARLDAEKPAASRDPAGPACGKEACGIHSVTSAGFFRIALLAIGRKCSVYWKGFAQIRRPGWKRSEIVANAGNAFLHARRSRIPRAALEKSHSSQRRAPQGPLRKGPTKCAAQRPAQGHVP